MNRKMLMFANGAGQRERVYFRNGVCRTPDTFDKVTIDGSGFAWDGIKTSGDTLDHMPNLSRRRYKEKLVVVIDPKFLGIQSQPKAVKEIVRDTEGKVVEKPKKQSVTPENIRDMTKLAEEGKTLKEAEAILGIPYAKLAVAAKKERIAFKAGQRGRRKKEIATN